MNPLGLFLDPPGPLLTHLHTVYMAYSECLPTRLNPLAERTCFSQVLMRVTARGGWASVGPRGFAAGGASYIQLKLAASDDTPYVAYSARTEGGKATVATLVDGAWSYHCVLKDLS